VGLPQVAIPENKKTGPLSFPFLEPENSSHLSLPRIQTAIQQPGAEIKIPAKMVVKMWE
jgi:hypothetical protein